MYISKVSISLHVYRLVPNYIFLHAPSPTIRKIKLHSHQAYYIPSCIPLIIVFISPNASPTLTISFITTFRLLTIKPKQGSREVRQQPMSGVMGVRVGGRGISETRGTDERHARSG